jgi:hypothetical protein
MVALRRFDAPRAVRYWAGGAGQETRRAATSVRSMASVKALFGRRMKQAPGVLASRMTIERT